MQNKLINSQIRSHSAQPLSLLRATVRTLALLSLLGGPGGVPPLRAQYSQRSAADIIRQGQERQRAVEKAGEDFRRGVQGVLEREQRRSEEEREERRRQQDLDREERAAERRRSEEERQREDFQRSLRQTQESQRQQQETINNILRNGQRNDSQPSSKPEPSVSPQLQNGNQPSPAERPATPPSSVGAEKLKASPLGGTPNDQGSVREGWTQWQHVSDNIWVSYTKVRDKFENGQPLWTWSLRNWNDRAVKTVWFEYYAKGSWHKDLAPGTLNPRASHGGWSSFTAVGDTAPSIRIREVEFK